MKGTESQLWAFRKGGSATKLWRGSGRREERVSETRKGRSMIDLKGGLHRPEEDAMGCYFPDRKREGVLQICGMGRPREAGANCEKIPQEGAGQEKSCTKTWHATLEHYGGGRDFRRVVELSSVGNRLRRDATGGG